MAVWASIQLMIYDSSCVFGSVWSSRRIKSRMNEGTQGGEFCWTYVGRRSLYPIMKPKLTINQTKRKKIENLAESRKWLDLGNIDPYNQPNQTKILKKV